MNRDMTVGDLVSLLKREIAERQNLIRELEARARPSSAPGRPRGGIATTAIDVLRDAGRPMHGLSELLPAIEARGVHIASRAGFATSLLRTDKITRTAPGTYALASASDAGGR
jgi:hypothetical protein